MNRRQLDIAAGVVLGVALMEAFYALGMDLGPTNWLTDVFVGVAVLGALLILRLEPR